MDDYRYELPGDRIAQRPLLQREASRLLVYREQTISDCIFSDLDRFLPKESLLVFNNTRVVRARLIFHKADGRLIEVFCLEPADHGQQDLQLAFSARGGCSWKCLVGNSRKWKSGTLEMYFGKPGNFIRASRTGEAEDGCFLVDFTWEPATMSFSEVLEEAGNVPLPPYIERPADETDVLSYQTMFAKYDGSVAAPTAGLHFTPGLLERIQERGIAQAAVTLHVGLGTFRPVSVSDIRDHLMHSEYFSVSLDTLRILNSYSGKTIIPVGTTSARTLESLYWLGVKAIRHPQSKIEEVSQWEPYEQEPSSLPGTGEALQALIDLMEEKGLQELRGRTGIIIVPGYNFHLAGGLITNFHMPGSTLLLMIAAMAGDGWKSVYRHALDQGYRFLSYGDACMFLPK
jgi:S-adenosylmethionine:tRNA ribosyltransferase-isomerase